MSDSDNSRRIFEFFARPPLDEDRLDQPGYAARFTENLRDTLDRNLNNPIWTNGRRIQNMFEAMIVAFDCYTLIKTEDAGTLHPSDLYSLPDFRIVLKDGVQILVEVKNQYCENSALQHFKIRTADLEKKLRYAEAVGSPLKLAIFWARWGVWTLIDPKHLKTRGRFSTIKMLDAFPFNETACIGDQSIGTRHPLAVRLVADHNHERRIVESGKAAITVAAIQTLCEGKILSGLDHDLALLLIQFGEWQEEEPVAITTGNLVDSVDYRFRPEEPSDQGFDFIGQATRMFSRYYSQRTTDNGKVIRTGLALQPGLFRILSVGDDTGHTLPLWRFHQQARKSE
jgi:hypothetical protein